MANIDVMDRRLRGALSGVEAYMERNDNRVDQTIMVDQTWNIRKICTYVRRQGQVGILRILCHGSPSFLQLGTGIRTPRDTTAFQLLRNIWAGEYPRIEVHACAVASSTNIACTFRWRPPGRDCTPGTLTRNSPAMQMLQSMADNAGVLVSASPDYQNNRPGFEGRVVHFRPAVYFTMRNLIRR